MNISYLLYQGEHIKSATEQREADIAAGRMAAAFGRRWRSGGRRRAARQPTVQIPRQACPRHDLVARM
jgi:hypothetical protein